MAKFELNIYGKNDEIKTTYATDFVRWGILLQALELEDGFSDLPVKEQLKAVSDFMKKIFPELTDNDLECADMDDVMNTFIQLTNIAGKIGGKRKNATRAATK